MALDFIVTHFSAPFEHILPNTRVLEETDKILQSLLSARRDPVTGRYGSEKYSAAARLAAHLRRSLRDAEANSANVR